MLSKLRRLGSSRDGVVAVEFALVAPVMILMFFGTIELTEAVNCKARVERAASTSADLVAQSTAVANADMTNIFNAANSIIFPFPSAPARIVISSIIDDGHGGAKVAWSNAQNATPRAAGSAVTVPSGLIVSGSGGSVILAEISYDYSSPTLVVLTGTITMTSSFYSKPRRSLAVTHT